MIEKVAKRSYRSAITSANTWLRALTVLGMVFGMIAPLLSPATTYAAQKDGTMVPILLKFKGAATAADMDAATRASGGQKVRDMEQLRTRVINVPANAAARILEAMARQPAVERAAAGVLMGMAEAPQGSNDPAYPRPPAHDEVRQRDLR